MNTKFITSFSYVVSLTIRDLWLFKRMYSDTRKNNNAVNATQKKKYEMASAIFDSYIIGFQFLTRRKTYIVYVNW